MIMRSSPVGDHAANGDVEVEVREMKRAARAVLQALEQRLQIRIRRDHPILAWIPQYIGNCRTKFLIGDDARTPEER